MSDVDDIIVAPGEIKINVPERIVNHPDVQVWEIDCDSKYPEIYIVGGDHYEVHLWASPDTLKVNEELRGTPTVIQFLGISWEQWQIMVEAARYTARICIWRDTRNEDRGD